MKFNTDKSFQIEYEKEEEIRMGLYASKVALLKDGRNVTASILGTSFRATIPRPFEPLSPDTSFAFIPTCPVYDDPRPIVLNTRSLEKFYIDSPGYITSNQFSRNKNLLLLNGYDKVVLFDCELKETLTIYKKSDNQNIVFSFLSSRADKIIMLLTANNTRKQMLYAFDLKGEHLETTFIKAPDDIFNFEFSKFEKLAEEDKYNLFNSHGYVFVAAGGTLNKWHFMYYDKETEEITLRSYIPVSEIYYNKKWGRNGCDIREKEVVLAIRIN